MPQILKGVLQSQYKGLYLRARVMKHPENKVFKSDLDIKYILVSSKDDSFGIGDIVEIEPKDFISWVWDGDEIVGVYYWEYTFDEKQNAWVRDKEFTALPILSLLLINHI